MPQQSNAQGRITLPTSQKEFESTARAFLEAEKFPVNADYLKLFGAMVQCLPEDEDFIEPSVIARRMRKAQINECAFYLMHPEKLHGLEKPEVPEGEEQVVPEAEE